MKENIIEINNVKKIYKLIGKNKRTVEAVKNVTLSIKGGEFVGLIGNNGAGKSTLVKMILGILYNDGGTIETFGKNPSKNRKENNKKIGVVFGQRTQLKWDLSPMQSFELLKVIYDIPDKIFKKNLDMFREIFKMDSYINQQLRTLSLGQKMRCEIASAFLHEPKLVLLDEPTIGLDIFSKEEIINFLKNIKEKQKLTLLLTTHDINDISSVCDRVILLDNGRIIVDESIKNLIKMYNPKKEMIIDLQERNPIKLLNEYDANIVYEDYKITVKNLDKKYINNFINDCISSNNVNDIRMKETNFIDIVKKIYE